jgi:2-methylcitrate dehydratase PrpD
MSSHHDGLTAGLAELVAETTAGDLPEGAVRSVERAYVDTVGVMLPGIDAPPGEIARRVFGTGGGASIVGTTAEASPTDAALVTAAAGHALDYDDVTGDAWHPSVTLVAPSLVVGQQVGAAGRDLLTAYVVGFEVETALGDLLLPGHYERGWHATSTLGTFGATAAAASLLDLDQDAVRHALTSAASMPSGLKANFGTMTKPLHAGLAARNGVTAAMLAAEGFSAAPGAIETDRGFLDLYGGDAVPDVAPADLGDPWSLVAGGLDVKKYPCCYYTHASIAAAQDLTAAQDLDPEDVERVTVTASPGAADALHYSDPETGLQAKFSMEYVIASAIARDRVGLAAFEDDAIGDPVVQAVRERVDFEVDPEASYDPFRTTVAITTTAGERRRRTRDRPPGTAEDPLSDAELRAKFDQAARAATASPDVERAYDAMDSLRTLEQVDDLIAALRPA